MDPARRVLGQGPLSQVGQVLQQVIGYFTVVQRTKHASLYVHSPRHILLQHLPYSIWYAHGNMQVDIGADFQLKSIMEHLPEILHAPQ